MPLPSHVPTVDRNGKAIPPSDRRPAAHMLAELPLALLQNGTLVELRKINAPPRDGAPQDLLLDLQPATASQSTSWLGGSAVVRGLAAELLPNHEHLFIEDRLEEGDTTCARLLWPHAPALAIRAFSPTDAVERMLLPAWRGARSVNLDEWNAQLPDRGWLDKLWEAISRELALSADEDLLHRLE
eukprot:2984030-Prymnesium_polylepis.1